MKSFSNILYAEPSFLEGIARILDLGSTLNNYNSSLSSRQADALALYSDWLTVGCDLELAIEIIEHEYPELDAKTIDQAKAILESSID